MVVLLILSLGSLALVACETVVPAEEADVVGPPPIPTRVVALAGDVLAARGSVVTSESLESSSDIARVASRSVRATYRSVDAVAGTTTQVTGAFYLPRGEVPTGGWPVVSFAHGTTGLANGCGPTQLSDLAGLGGTVAALLGMGYAVAMTDYAGLGPDGVHQYLQPTSAAYNVIDAVRALRAISPAVSDRWLAYGPSQGGQAVWAADELAATYGDGLNLVGAVAMEPAADITRLVDLADANAMSSEQQAIYPMVVEGVHRVDPSLPLSDYLGTAAVSRIDALVGCDRDARRKATDGISPSDLRPASTQAADRLREYLRRIALPQKLLTAPLLVVNGLNDQTILPSWVRGATQRQCDTGGRVVHYEIPGVGHSDLTPNKDVTNWMTQRFLTDAAPSNCRTE
ncbi:lipase family protein [Gordonia sputi]